MKTIKTFKKKGCIKVELIYDTTFDYALKMSEKGETLNCFLFDNMHDALNMFWYCVSLTSGLNKYIK